MISIEFLITSLVVVVIPGTGVIYTVATGLVMGKRASCIAAFGCTMGIVPALLASSFGLAALFHTSALAFQLLKYLGAVYLLYLAWQIWHSASPINVKKDGNQLSYFNVGVKGFLINILNPKLSIFFLAFLPQFIPVETNNALPGTLVLGVVFMLMTFIVFVIYGFLAGSFKQFIDNSEQTSTRIQQMFAVCFAILGLKLALD